ncbi:hypothetical protein NP233_g12432 [Leucocoprinus birnbaumii]|uniref:Uncharacterized protein n=1 Tax=Leucocoprinus birnbaumii TaxID=56174 RepID=A0AAD5YN30_9AGAR|nr:hypothetical protein NP233_g12432 [Leucocoprinus birnbaumii]
MEEHADRPQDPIHEVKKGGRKKKKTKRKNKSHTSAIVPQLLPQFGKLPEKIQRRVFEWAFHFEPTIGPALARVCRKVNKWIEPLIYEYIVIDRFERTSSRPDRLWRTFSDSSKTKDFFEERVEGILVNGMVDPVVTDLLSVCTNIRSLACYAQGPLPDTILEKLASIISTKTFPNLRHLSISGFGFEPIEIRRPFFQSLTHLAVDIGDNYECFPWQELKTHPCLTHILIDMHLELHENTPNEFRNALKGILSHSPPTLVCFIVLLDWDALYESFFQQKCDRSVFADAIRGKLDERVVVAAYTGDREEIDVTVFGENPMEFVNYVGYVALTPDDTVPWICPPNGARRSIWTRAEDALKQRSDFDKI